MLLAACGGGEERPEVPAVRAIGSTVTGLASGTQLVLNNQVDDPLSVSANGPFTFATPVAHDGSYAITVATQPAGQTCTVSNGSGAGITAAVSHAIVTCSTHTYTIGGTVTGLAGGAQVTLLNNGSDPRTVRPTCVRLLHAGGPWQQLRRHRGDATRRSDLHRLERLGRRHRRACVQRERDVRGRSVVCVCAPPRSRGIASIPSRALAAPFQAARSRQGRSGTGSPSTRRGPSRT